jgi:hypothetical protein
MFVSHTPSLYAANDPTCQVEARVVCRPPALLGHADVETTQELWHNLIDLSHSQLSERISTTSSIVALCSLLTC